MITRSWVAAPAAGKSWGGGAGCVHKGFGRSTFSIGQHVNNLPLLEAFKTYFSIETITIDKDIAYFTVSNKDQLNKFIIPHLWNSQFILSMAGTRHAIRFLKWKNIVAYLLKIRADGRVLR